MLPVFYLDHNSVILAVNKGVANATMFEALPMTSGWDSHIFVPYLWLYGGEVEGKQFIQCEGFKTGGQISGDSGVLGRFESAVRVVS